MTDLSELVGRGLERLSPYRTPADPLEVKLDANESPWPLPEEVRDAIARRVAELPLHRYPDRRARALRSAIAERVGALPEELVLGVGSDEVIGIAMAALDRPRPGRERPALLYPSPSFVMYPITATVQGFEPVAVPLDDDWRLDVPAMREAIERHDPNLVFLATPNNPTGNAFDDAAMREVVEHARGALVVIDEAYAPFAGRSLGAWVDEHENVAVMSTLSKIGLAGIRVGWMRARPPIVSALEKARPPYNVPSPSQAIAQELLTRHAGALDAQVERIVSERRRLREALAALEGVQVFDSVANFVLVEVPDAPRWADALREDGVQVRRFASPARLASHLRITVGTPPENDRLLASLRRIVAL